MFKLSTFFVAVILCLSVCLTAKKSNAQSQQEAQWPFYLAFEDATNAKDTIWLTYDSAAGASVYDLEPALGEIPLDTTTNQFRIWMYLDDDGNQTDTRVFNINNEFHGPELYADNYVLPISISWDSTLFTAPVLYEYGDPVYKATFDNEYFFFENNDPLSHLFHLTYDNHVVLEPFNWGSMNHFPIFVSFLRGPLGSGVGLKEADHLEFSVYPNPASTNFKLTFAGVVAAQIRLYDTTGKLIMSSQVKADSKQLDLSKFESGLYFLEVQDDKGRMVKKVIVNK